MFEDVARRAAPSVGVMGEYGGLTGDADCECEGELGECPREC